MSGLEDRLTLDITDALQAIARIEDAFTAVGTSFQQSIEQALQSLNVASDVTVNADTTAITPEIDAAVNAADTQLELFADADPITQSIDAAVAQSDSTIAVDADTSQAKDAIDALSGETVDVAVDVQGADAAASDLASVSTAATSAGDGAHSAAGEFAGLSVASKLAAGEVGAASEALKLSGAAGATAAGALAAVAIAGKELFSNALDARSAQQRFNLVLGETADVVEHIDIGGLNVGLSDFATNLGSTGKEVENAASKIFALGTNSGETAPKVAETTKEIIALAGRAVALNPALGNVGDVAERALSGLARGGRFAANLGLALTGAEISARALADTGKTVAADLTIYEKAAAGAEIATERLGTHLSTDIAEGSKNVQIQLNAVKARFEEALEALGQPLLDPVIEGITKAEPVLVELASLFAAVLPSIVSVGAAFADSLLPALEGLAPIAGVIGTGLGAVADVLNAIPGPVRSTAVAIGLLTLALTRFAPAATEAAVASGSLGTGLLAAASGLLPLTGAIAGSLAGITFVKNEVKATDKNVQDYLDSWIKLLNTSPDVETFTKNVNDLAAAANQTGDAANKLNNIGGRLFQSGDLRANTEAATGLRSIIDAATPLGKEMEELQKQYHLTSQAAAALVLSGEAQVAAFKEQAAATKELTGSQALAAQATHDFFLAAQTGALTATDIANQAQIAGVSFDDMSKAVDEARKPIVDFAGQVEAALPGATKALSDLGDNVSLDKFVKNLEKNVEDSAKFIANLQTLIDRGATDLAKLIEEQSKTDPNAAAKLASQAVAKSQAALDAVETKVDASNFGRGLVNSATQNVTNELSGGLELAADKAREAFGKRLELIPGQLGASTTVIGTNIGSDLANALLDSPALKDLPTNMAIVGTDAMGGFKSGLTGDAIIGIQIAAENAAKTVLDATRRILGIHSPSTVMKDIGELTIEGFFAGLADVSGAADAIKPILDVVDKFKLNADQIKSAAGDSIDQVTASLKALGEQQDKLTPDKLLAVGAAVKALGGSKGVKDLQNALAQQVSAAFGGLGGKDIADIVTKLNTVAAVNRAQDIFGVTPTVPKPFQTNVVKGPDVAAPNIENLNVTVTPPPDATPMEIASDVAIATSWAIQSVSA